ncbi:PREDICTED: uncharacterized protein LOC104743763 [Camelina sativa]|uniref:Uncharacterized protein LOC104743763 n=1 Tax=Camelina sativa TaxID=90675 RepID=A0ABM0VYK1_CAMSA|nr:PREDICTED: uncharacterized protein LOC104743763 [Camelina sativa]
MVSQSSGSDVNSNRSWDPLCSTCGRVTTVAKSWTNDNPGRRFYKCVVHGFCNWADEHSPYGWQKVSLLEAIDEIKQLKESLRAMNEQMVSGSNTDLLKTEDEEKKKLEISVMAATEREKMLRQFILLSWGGFIVVIGLILAMGK